MPSRKNIEGCVPRASPAVPWSKAERCCDGTSHESFGLMQASRRDTGTAWSLSHAWPTPYPLCALPALSMLRRLQQGLQTGCKTIFWRAAPQCRCCVRCCVAFSLITNIKEACSYVRHFRFRALCDFVAIDWALPPMQVSSRSPADFGHFGFSGLQRSFRSPAIALEFR
jgi:hypothetical protein